MSVTINVFDGGKSTQSAPRQSVAAKRPARQLTPIKASAVKTATPGAAQTARTVPAQPKQLSKSAKRKRIAGEAAKSALIPGYGLVKAFKGLRRRKRR